MPRKYAEALCSFGLIIGIALAAPLAVLADTEAAAADTASSTPSEPAPVVPLGPFVMDSGAHVSVGGAWTNAARADQLENAATLAPADVLSKIDQLPVSEWNYKTEGATVKHVGPTADDFYAAFGLGGQAGTISISTVDSAGVALLGIQALSQRLDALEKGQGTDASADTSGDSSNAGSASGDDAQATATSSSDETTASSTSDAASSTPTVTDGSGVLDTLGYAAGEIVNGVVHFGQVVVDKITATLGVFTRIETDDIHVSQRLCLGSTCVTESELKALLNGGTPGAITTSETPATSTPDLTATSTPAISESVCAPAPASSTPSESTSTPATAESVCKSASSTPVL